MYLVYYEYGDYGDNYGEELFVTDSLDFAEKYVKKFNRILEKAKKQYEHFYEKDNNKWFDRFSEIYQTYGAKIKQVKFRNEFKSKV